MTPLAFDLLKDLTAPGAFVMELPTDYAKSMESEMGRDRMAETNRKLAWLVVQKSHFFDMTSVTPLILDLADKMRAAYDERNLFKTRLAFLPAPDTWLEFMAGGQRVACVLLSDDASTSKGQADVAVFRRQVDGCWNFHGCASIPLVDSEQRPERADLFAGVHDRRFWTGKLAQGADAEYGPVEYDQPRSSWLHFACYAALAIINTPRVIGRRQHMPHERLEREKLKQLKLVGKFPLRAWTEIVLKVAPPDIRTGEPSTEAHLTGEKCLYFCRTHLRVRLGQLEYVEAHWRGNPALGMKRSRYRVEKERQE